MSRQMFYEPQADDRALLDLADALLSRRTVRWICPYCLTEVAHEWTPHCGEAHARPMTDEEQDEA